MRSSVPLPAPAAVLAESLGLPVADRSRILLDIVRLAFDTPDGADPKDVELRSRLNAALAASTPGETVPLPLDPSIWRETILRRDVPDSGLIAAILSDRRTALLYHGLASLDDETLGWLGPERELLSTLLAHAGPFATSAVALKIRAGRVIVPGGSEGEAIWARVVGASPDRPAAFVRRLITGSQGRLAYFYSTVSQLDEPRQRFALAHGRAIEARVDRVHALAEVFERSFGELRVDERPFARHPMDPAITLSTVLVDAEGRPLGPAARWLWEEVFRNDRGPDPLFAAMKADKVSKRPDAAPADAAWLAARIHASGLFVARRRLDAVLLAQRVFRGADPDADLITALRGMLAFPALHLTLERCGVVSPAVHAAAAQKADALTAIGNDEDRRDAIRLFQTSLGIIDRSVVMGGLRKDAAVTAITSLLALDLSKPGLLPAFVRWFRNDAVGAMTGRGRSGSPEQVVLAALAGLNDDGEEAPTVEWEGRTYRVSPAVAELGRLRRVRARQEGGSLDDALQAAGSASGVGDDGGRRARSEARALADTLSSILYAAYLGEPDGRLLAAGNIPARHDLGIDSGAKVRPFNAWRFASEAFRQVGGWRLTGSLLGLDVPLSKFALRRMDFTTMPPAPRMTSTERQTAALTVVLMRAHEMTDRSRDEIAAAVRRGRERLAALRPDREEVDRFARDAGLSAWRRESLSWTLEHDPGQVESLVSLVELFWLGSARSTGSTALDAWGSAAAPLTGCLCLEMPRPGPWEFLGGRPSIGLLASRGADAAVLVAEELAALRLPAALAPGVMAFVMQDVIDLAQPAYFDDWFEFGRSARSLPRDRVIDYVAALTAGGPLLPVETNGGKGH